MVCFHISPPRRVMMQELMLAMSDWQPILTMSALRTMVMSMEAKSSAFSRV